MRTTEIKKHAIIFRRILTFAILAQLALVLLFTMLFSESKPLSLDDCSTATVVVDETEYVRELGKYKLRIIADGKIYEFPDSGIFGGYNLRELYYSISRGETVTLSYTDGYYFGERYNLIADARGNEVYLDFAEYNADRSVTSFAVMISFLRIELVLAAAVIVGILFHTEGLHPLFKKKRA